MAHLMNCHFNVNVETSNNLINLTIIFFFFSGLQKTFGRKQPADSESQQGSTFVPQSSGNLALPFPIQDCPVRGHQELGSRREDRRRLRGLVFEGRRARDLLGLHQQLHCGHGVCQTRIQTQVCSRGLPQGEADHGSRQGLLLRSHGQTRAKVPSVHPTPSRSSQGNPAWPPADIWA